MHFLLARRSGVHTTICTCTYEYISVHTYIPTNIHACMHACMHAYIHTYVCTHLCADVSYSVCFSRLKGVFWKEYGIYPSGSHSPVNFIRLGTFQEDGASGCRAGLLGVSSPEMTGKARLHPLAVCYQARALGIPLLWGLRTTMQDPYAYVSFQGTNQEVKIPQLQRHEFLDSSSVAANKQPTAVLQVTPTPNKAQNAMALLRSLVGGASTNDGWPLQGRGSLKAPGSYWVGMGGVPLWAHTLSGSKLLFEQNMALELNHEALRYETNPGAVWTRPQIQPPARDSTAPEGP